MNNLPEETKSYSPGRVFLSGLLAGITIVTLGVLMAFLLGAWKPALGPTILWFVSPLGCAIAAGTAAFRKGGTRDRVISLTLFALFIGILLSILLDYVVLWSIALESIALPAIYPNRVISLADMPWRRHLATYFTTITVGAFLGMNYGKRFPPEEL
jgi:hypothetical protein